MIRLNCDHLLSDVVNSVQSILRRSSTQPVPCVEIPPRVEARLYELSASGRMLVMIAAYVQDGDFLSFRRAQFEGLGSGMQVLPKSIRRTITSSRTLETVLHRAVAGRVFTGRIGGLFDVSLFDANMEMAMKERIDNEPV